MVLEHKKQVDLVDDKVNKLFIGNNRDIEKYLDEQLLSLKEALNEESQKNNTIQQGKSQQYTIEIEGRILNKVSAILDENSKLKSEIFKKVDQAN